MKIKPFIYDIEDIIQTEREHIFFHKIFGKYWGLDRFFKSEYWKDKFILWALIYIKNHLYNNED